MVFRDLFFGVLIPVVLGPYAYYQLSIHPFVGLSNMERNGRLFTNLKMLFPPPKVEYQFIVH